MQYPVSVTELQTTEGHCHPAFNIRRQEHKRAVFDDHLEVRIKEL